MMKKQTHDEKNLPVVIIVGPMPFDWKILKKALKNPCEGLFFVDGGLNHWQKFSKKFPIISKKKVSVGDGDSSKSPMNLRKNDQDLSDLAYLLHKVLLKKSFAKRRVNYHFVGFLGGRLDHQLFNFGELFSFSEKIKKSRSQISLDNTIDFIAPGKKDLEIHGVFSVASFKTARLKISGDCLYPTKKTITLKSLSSLGLSNEGHGVITFESDVSFLLFYN